MILEIKDLNFSYDNKNWIYKDFNLNVSVGDVVSIVGESGSGKSTLLELITKNLIPQKGSISTQNISMVFQDPYTSFHNSYSILNQIKDVCEVKEIDKLLSELNLSNELLNKKPYELSGGQLQRCSILRAILMKPKLLLCDEPTSALDNISAVNVMKLLMNYLDDLGIVLITHDLDLASWCSDKIVNLNEIKVKR